MIWSLYLLTCATNITLWILLWSAMNKDVKVSIIPFIGMAVVSIIISSMSKRWGWGIVHHCTRRAIEDVR